MRETGRHGPDEHPVDALRPEVTVVTRLQDDWERTPQVARVFYVLAAVALLLSFFIDDLALWLTGVGLVCFVIALVLQFRPGARR